MMETGKEAPASHPGNRWRYSGSLPEGLGRDGGGISARIGD